MALGFLKRTPSNGSSAPGTPTLRALLRRTFTRSASNGSNRSSASSRSSRSNRSNRSNKGSRWPTLPKLFDTQGKKKYAAAARRMTDLKADAFKAQRLVEDLMNQVRAQEYKPASQRNTMLVNDIRRNHAQAKKISNNAQSQLQRLEAGRRWTPGPFDYHAGRNNVSWDAPSAAALHAISKRTVARANATRSTKWLRHVQPTNLAFKPVKAVSVPKPKPSNRARLNRAFNAPPSSDPWHKALKPKKRQARIGNLFNAQGKWL